jgi:hypothetical protein
MSLEAFTTLLSGREPQLNITPVFSNKLGLQYKGAHPFLAAGVDSLPATGIQVPKPAEV